LLRLQSVLRRRKAYAGKTDINGKSCITWISGITGVSGITGITDITEIYGIIGITGISCLTGQNDKQRSTKYYNTIKFSNKHI
jgi:hypothetical protein